MFLPTNQIKVHQTPIHNMSPRPKTFPLIVNDSWEIEEDENIEESFRENLKPLISNFNRAKEEIKDEWYLNFSRKSSTPKSKNMSFVDDFFMKIDNESCSLGDANEMNEKSVRNNFIQYGRKIKGEKVDLSRK